MQLQENVSLKDYSTMRLGGPARYLCEVTNRQEASQAIQWATSQQMPVMMIGGGSNIIWRDEGFNGLVIVNKILGYEDFPEDETHHYITIGAGENWDEIVARTTEAGLTGIECLSLVPGSAGGTPIQNVGAYGQEIADTLVSVEAFDITNNGFITIPASDCAFGYRTSRFKTTDKNRFFITHITLHLTKGNPLPPFYPALQQFLEDQRISSPTSQHIRDAVCTIRRAKLPDPAKVANNGSFFANPIIRTEDFSELVAKFGNNIPHWDAGVGLTKIPAAWLIEQAGFKDVHDESTGMATWARQPLVLVNEHATSTAQLIQFRDNIIASVAQKFGITLQQEPELLP